MVSVVLIWAYKDLTDCKDSSIKLIMEIKMLEKRNDKYYIDNFEVMDGINNVGWWDGPIRYKKVNRNIISWVQHDTLFHLISKLSGKIGIDMGGPSGKPIDGIINVNLCFPNLLGKNEMIIGRCETLPFKNDSIDYIISSHTLEHIKNTEDVLRECLRVLKIGSLIAIIIPDKRYFLHDPKVVQDGETAWSEMEPNELLNILKKFMNIEIISFNTLDNNFEFECIIKKLEILK